MQDNILSLRPDRALMLRYLDSHVDQAHHDGEQLAVLVIQFERGNDLASLFTSRSIESLLEQVASRLSDVCRKQDRVARTGDFQYVMFLPGILNQGHALLAANKVLLGLAAPFRVGDRDIPAEVRIGISLFPDHGARPETLYRYAESALDEARENRLPYALYSGRALDRLAEDWDMEGAIETGLQNGEFEVHFQPIIALHDRALAGAEALVRWRHPEHGLISPDEFLPVVTRCGKLGPLTWSVLNMALEHASRWPGVRGSLQVAVNIDPSLLDEGLVTRVADALALWGTQPGTLTLELTETGVMNQPEMGFEALQRLRGAGVRIAIDDFGTGYSSLANFRHVPANELKMDRSFVTRMLQDPFDSRIVRSIVALAKAFDIVVAAEGAENYSTLGRLAAMGCDYAQGYCISAPLPAPAFAGFVTDYQPMIY